MLFTSPERSDSPILKNQSASTNVLMAAAMLLAGIPNILWAEKVTVGGGFGWDGILYGRWVRDFFRPVFIDRVPEYNLQRIVPSAILHYVFRLLPIALTDANILRAFDIYNLALLTIGAWVWGRIADRLGITTPGKWLGFAFLFLNYATLKLNFYTPASTDTTAFFLGILLFYAYVADRALGILAIMVVSYFTWPTLPLFAALLYVFPRQRETRSPSLPSRRLNVIVAAAAAAAVALGTFVLAVPLRKTSFFVFGSYLRIDYPILYISLACSCAYVFAAVKRATADDRLYEVQRWLTEIRWRRAVVAFLLLGALKLTSHFLANGLPGPLNPKLFAAYSLLTAVTDPFLFLVAHVVYFGPAVLLLLLLWKQVCAEAAAFGFGMQLFLLLNIVFSLNSQSRYNIPAVPALFALLVLAMQRRSLSRRVVVALTVLAVACSKVWYIMNTAPQIYDGTMACLLRFPLQHMFMNSGPWMSREMYIVQGLIVVAIGAALYWFVVREDRVSGRAAAVLGSKVPA
jgi:hypothetical protein